MEKNKENDKIALMLGIGNKNGKIYRKPRLGTYTLHTLQGQLSGFHFLTFNMNEFNVDDIFMSKGSKSQILGPIFLIVSSPQNTVLTLGVMKSLEFLKL